MYKRAVGEVTFCAVPESVLWTIQWVLAGNCGPKRDFFHYFSCSFFSANLSMEKSTSDFPAEPKGRASGKFYTPESPDRLEK